jgi:hypothetical protein
LHIINVHLFVVENSDVSGCSKFCGAKERVDFDGWDDVDILGWLVDVVH